MTLPYDLHVQFEKTGEDGVLAGVVTVVVCEDCTCRKLLLWPGRSTDGGGFLPKGPVQTLGDWVEWRAGETHHYPFSASTEPGGDGVWGVRAQVHRVGEWEADPEQVLLAAPVAQLMPAQPDLAEARRLPTLAAAEHELLGWHGSATPSPVVDVSLEFDQEEHAFHFGDEISGAVTFTPARDLVDYRLGLDYQWRTHGQTERRSGEHHPVAISAQSAWEAGQPYRLPFRFSIPDGPRTSHGHSEKLDWYVWPVLIPLDGSEPAELLQAETKIELLPILETASALQVKSLSAAATNHLVLAFFILLVGLLVGVAVVANLFGWGPAWTDLGRGLVALIAFVILVAGLIELFERGLAEYYLGIPGVHIAGTGEVRATVWLQPRRHVRLAAVKLALKVDEETTVGVGTTSKTSSRVLFSRTEKLSLGEEVAAGQEWSTAIVVPFPANLPVTETRRVSKDTKVAIIWRAELSILQLGHAAWCKGYKLTVREPVAEARPFWMVKP